jgi:hypothetical protein
MRSLSEDIKDEGLLFRSSEFPDRLEGLILLRLRIQWRVGIVPCGLAKELVEFVFHEIMECSASERSAELRFYISVNASFLGTGMSRCSRHCWQGRNLKLNDVFAKRSIEI